MRPTRSRDAGITLIEIMVSMAIFGLIGTAGFSMLDQTLRTRAQTEGRLELLGRLQRTMYLINLDFMLAEGHSLIATPDDKGSIVALRRTEDKGSVDLRYVLQDGVLLRELGPANNSQVQTLIDGIEHVQLRFRSADDTAWRDTWPPAPPPQGEEAANPQAVEVTLVFLTGQDSVRRVVLLPDGMP